MKRALAALLAAPLLLTACSSEPETQPNADTETATVEAGTIDPAGWETLDDMQQDIDAITGECNENVEEEYGVGYCFNGTVMLAYAIGTLPANDVIQAAKMPDSNSEGYIVSHDEWSVYCAVLAGGTLSPAHDICSQIQDAIPGSRWGDAETEDKDDLGNEVQAETPTETTPPEPATTFTDGTHMVGSDIQPGTYRNEGNETCYWARLSGFGGTVEDIIANDNPRGQGFVTIGADDVAFKSQLCGTWELVE